MRKYLKLLRRYPDLPMVTALRAYFAPSERHVRARSGPSIAIQCVPDAVYLGLFEALVRDINSLQTTHIELVVFKSISAAMGLSFLSELRRSAASIWVAMEQWIRSMPSADAVAYRSSSWSHPIEDAVAIWTSYRGWRRWVRSAKVGAADIADFAIDGMVCGDLIIDSTLRFSPSPEFDIGKPLVWRIIWQAHRDVARARRYFGRRPPLAFLTSYSTYIEHGIAARVAIEQGVPVYSFGNFVTFAEQLSRSHSTHAPDCVDYRRRFEALSVGAKSEALEEARRALENRLSGGKDAATAYMRRSAYAADGDGLSADDQEELAGSVVVFLHDFYDSPHVWEDFVFTDFWDWVCFTIETLQAASIKTFIKPHPNQIALGDEAVARLKTKYPQVRWLDSTVNNVALANAPIACGATVFGTIAHELAFLGVATVGAATHAHRSFDFCRTAKTREEYAELLLDYRTLPVSKAEMREQALAFYCMHNNLTRPEKAATSLKYLEYWRLSAAALTDDESQAAVDALDILRNDPGYKRLVQELAKLPSMSQGQRASDR